MSARAGLLLGAHASGSSYQPNLLSRASRDQAIIAGVAASTAFGWGTTSHSFLRSLADRWPGAMGSARAQLASGIAVDGLIALVGASAAALLGPRRDEQTVRSLLRLAAGATSASAMAGVAANLLELTARRRGGRLLTLAATLGSWGVAFARIRHQQARAGSAPVDGREAEEDVIRVVSIPTAVASGPVVSLALVGVAVAESALSSAAARAAAVVLGGTSNDRRTAGRALALGAWRASAMPHCPLPPGS